MGTVKTSVHNTLFYNSSKTKKKVLDKKGFVGAALMDLYKAFDTIKHDLPIAKLYSYGFNKESIKLLHSHLSSR